MTETEGEKEEAAGEVEINKTAEGEKGELRVELSGEK